MKKPQHSNPIDTLTDFSSDADPVHQIRSLSPPLPCAYQFDHTVLFSAIQRGNSVPPSIPVHHKQFFEPKDPRVTFMPTEEEKNPTQLILHPPAISKDTDSTNTMTDLTEPSDGESLASLASYSTLELTTQASVSSNVVSETNSLIPTDLERNSTSSEISEDSNWFNSISEPSEHPQTTHAVEPSHFSRSSLGLALSQLQSRQPNPIPFDIGRTLPIHPQLPQLAHPHIQPAFFMPHHLALPNPPPSPYPSNPRAPSQQPPPSASPVPLFLRPIHSPAFLPPALAISMGKMNPPAVPPFPLSVPSGMQGPL